MGIWGKRLRKNRILLKFKHVQFAIVLTWGTLEFWTIPRFKGKFILAAALCHWGNHGRGASELFASPLTLHITATKQQFGSKCMAATQHCLFHFLCPFIYYLHVGIDSLSISTCVWDLSTQQASWGWAGLAARSAKCQPSLVQQSFNYLIGCT